MTIDTFLTVLARTPNDWFLDDGRIRRIDNAVGKSDARVCCPITALGQERKHGDFLRDSVRLGLTLQDTVTLAATADNHRRHPDFDPVLRFKLLRATILRVGKPTRDALLAPTAMLLTVA